MNKDEDDDDRNHADIVWIYDNPDSLFLGDRCFTCGVAQDSETLVGTYSRHARDCEYAPRGARVSGSIQNELDRERLNDLAKEAMLNYKLEQEQQRLIAERSSNSKEKDLSRLHDSPNTLAMKNFGLSFAKLMTTFDANLAMSEISRYKAWLETYPGSEDPDPGWIHFLNEYVKKINVLINNSNL